MGDSTHVGSYTYQLRQAMDYLSFGDQMQGRFVNSGYRYGFNGKQDDDNVKGNYKQIDYGMRIYDPRVARFLSLDPLAKTYPWYTPYQFAGNTPIQAVDRDGLEEWKVNDSKNVVTGPYANHEEAQRGLNKGDAHLQPPAATLTPPAKNVTFKKPSQLSEFINTAHFLWTILTADPSQPIAAQPEATTSGAQVVEMIAPYVPYEKLIGAVISKVVPETVKAATSELANKFSSGASKLTSTTMLDVYPQSATFGDPFSTFVAPTKEIDELLSQGFNRKEIAIKLGIDDPNFLQ